MYKIIGADQKEYGPVTAEQINQWIAQGRANAATRAKAEGTTDWKPLSDLPEFAATLAAKAAPLPPAVSGAGPELSTEQLLARDYQVNLGDVVSQGWALLTNNFGVLFGAYIIAFLILVALGALGMIPIIGLLFSLISLIISGPLLGGVYSVYVRTLRRQPAQVGEVFAGFQTAFVQLLLAYVVVGLLTMVAAIPGAVVAGVGFGVFAATKSPLAFLLVASGGLLALAAAFYLGVSWAFTLLLVMDKGLDFWPAMRLGRQMVGKHWWKVFLVLLVLGLLALAGVLACGIGILFTLALALAAYVCVYETLFGAPATPAA